MSDFNNTYKGVDKGDVALIKGGDALLVHHDTPPPPPPKLVKPMQNPNIPATGSLASSISDSKNDQ